MAAGVTGLVVMARAGPMAPLRPNFVILDGSLPDVGRLVAAMLKARQAVETRA